jgi:hypothetical protein
MPTIKTTKTLRGKGVAFILLLSAIALAGCSSTGKTGTSESSTGKGGAQLWAANCAHCHSSRSPSAYSDSEWEVVMFHMRIRGNLTAEENRKIAEFLKASN